MINIYYQNERENDVPGCFMYLNFNNPLPTSNFSVTVVFKYDYVMPASKSY